ncbi:uncharacterized protein LOC124888804 [Capsicum annuum]|uniref:uncharacterized protein LOC124888804 n=1 Tax=Capsicum annuum TaxID=4072 RepID=UPI001FB13706|nr:uncharacterized protein LOC124888804 [Capsicum annuum]
MRPFEVRTHCFAQISDLCAHLATCGRRCNAEATGIWTMSPTVADRAQFQHRLGTGKFVNGKLCWTASAGLDDYDVCNIIYLDLADETWGSLEVPIGGEDYSNFKLGVVGSDLSMLYTCQLDPTTTTNDVWILKDCIFWTKLIAIEYHARRHVSTGQLKHTLDVDRAHAEEIYVESLVNPLTLSDLEASQSLCL